MSRQEKLAWWSLGSGFLIWLYLLVQFTEAGRIVDLPAEDALAIYIQMIVLWVVASAVPALLAEKGTLLTDSDERDRAIAAFGSRCEGYVVVTALNVLIVYALARAVYADRTPSVPIPDFSSTTALIFSLLTTLFLADAVKRAVVLWQYHR